MRKPFELRHFRNYVLKSDGDWPASTARATYSPWLPYGDLTLKSGLLWIGEPTMLFPESGMELEVGKGKSIVEAMGVALGNYRCLSRLRLVRTSKEKNPPDPQRGKMAGRIDIDEALVALCDLQGMMKAFGPKEHGKVRGMIKRGRKHDGDYGQYKLTLDNNSKHMFLYAKAGLGDGSYPVYPLKRDGEVVGVELVFIGKETPGWRDSLKAPVIGQKDAD